MHQSEANLMALEYIEAQHFFDYGIYRGRA
jgi:hypothetical protein